MMRRSRIVGGSVPPSPKKPRAEAQPKPRIPRAQTRRFLTSPRTICAHNHSATSRLCAQTRRRPNPAHHLCARPRHVCARRPRIDATTAAAPLRRVVDSDRITANSLFFLPGPVMPPISWNEIRQRAITFSRTWSDAAREQAESQTFWNEFFEVFGKSAHYSFRLPNIRLHLIQSNKNSMSNIYL